MGSCKVWGNNQTKVFQCNVRILHQNDPSEPGYRTPKRFLSLCKHMLQSKESVNKDKQVRSLKQESLKWEEFVEKMISLIRRNPPIFFRRAKALHLVVTPPIRKTDSSEQAGLAVAIPGFIWFEGLR